MYIQQIENIHSIQNHLEQSEKLTKFRQKPKIIQPQQISKKQHPCKPNIYQNSLN